MSVEQHKLGPFWENRMYGPFFNKWRSEDCIWVFDYVLLCALREYILHISPLVSRVMINGLHEALQDGGARLTKMNCIQHSLGIKLIYLFCCDFLEIGKLQKTEILDVSLCPQYLIVSNNRGFCVSSYVFTIVFCIC